MDLLNWITQACSSLTSTVAPSVDAMGVHICVALATIMLVWFGVQEALASAHGGPGFNMGKFLSFFMLITFAYAMVKFYDSSIPGIGVLAQGLHQWRSTVSCQLDRHRQRDQHFEHIAAGPDKRRARHDVHADESVQLHHLCADSGAHCRPLRPYQRHYRLRSCGKLNHWYARTRSSYPSLSSTSWSSCSGDGSAPS